MYISKDQNTKRNTVGLLNTSYQIEKVLKECLNT